MADGPADNTLLGIYERRIGDPASADEVYGYYVFLVGALLAGIGILWFLIASGGGGGPSTREFAYVLAAGGFVLLLAGAVYRLPLSRRATYAVYIGGPLSLIGLALFAAQFPRGWSVGTTSSNVVILLYVGGIAVMAIGTIIAPTERGQTASELRREQEAAQIRAENEARGERIAELEAELETVEGERDELRAERDDLEAERDDLAAERDELATERQELAERLDDAESERDDLAERLEAAAAERDEARYQATAERDAREEMAARADELGAALAAAREEREAESERAEAAEDRLARLQASQASFDVYRDKAGKWRWRLVHRNGNIIATSGQGYSNDRGARRGMRSVTRNALGAAVVWQRDEEEPDPEPELVREESRATFELYEDRGGDHRFRLRHENGNTIAAAARGFGARASATDAVEAVRSYIAPADYLRFDPAGIEVFEDSAGEYRWRLVHRNGRILADSGEGYASRSNARRAVEGFQRTAGEAAVDAESGARYETYEDSAGEYRWRLVASNDEIIADCGGGYAGRSSLQRAVERVQEYGPAADTLTVGAAAVELYEDSAGEYRWRLRHRNGTILAVSGEGYASRSGAIDGVNSVKRNAPEAEATRLEAADAEAAAEAVASDADPDGVPAAPPDPAGDDGD